MPAQISSPNVRAIDGRSARVMTSSLPLTESDTHVAATEIAGLDDILGGGLARRRLFLVEGVPGSGKTTLALQYLRAGVEAGEAVLYVTLSETEEELHSVAESHGWQ